MSGVVFVLGTVLAAPVIRTCAEGFAAFLVWVGERRTDRLAR